MDNLKRGADSDSENNIAQKRQRVDLEQKISAKREQVINIIKREFQNEINKKQDEVHSIQQQLLKAQKTLHLLKYVVVKSFYDRKELKITSNDESGIKSNDFNTQSRIHPEVKNLIGKEPAGHGTFDFARTRGQTQTIQSIFLPSEKQVTTESIFLPSVEQVTVRTNKKEQDPLEENQITQQHIIKEERKVPIRNKQKIKHKLVIGNISKYCPSANSKDPSTHKWMVYVRGPRENPNIDHIVKKVKFFLHPSYKPNDVFQIETAPFHLSRRGWGEFPLRIRIHFHNNLNKPVDVIHNLKLDQNKTGRQTLGNETLINVWLYDSTSILEENEETNKTTNDENKVIKKALNLKNIRVKTEKFDEIEHVEDEENIINENGGDEIIEKENNFRNIQIKTEKFEAYEHVDISKRIKNIKLEKENNETTSKISEITQPQPGCSRDHVDVPDTSDHDIITHKNIVFSDQDYSVIPAYLVDHCYTGVEIDESILENIFVKDDNIDREKYKFDVPLDKFTDLRQIVYFLFKKLPLITNLAEDPSYKYHYPYVAKSQEEFCKWNYAKRCCQEWYRAKTIRNLLQEQQIPGHEEWSTKFILMFGRAHLFTPLPNYDIFKTRTEAGKTLPNNMTETDFTSTYTEHIPISTLMENNVPRALKEEEDFVDIENISGDIEEEKPKRKELLKSSETDPDLLPLCNYIKRCAAQLEINLQDEEIEPGLFCNSSERVILQSVTCLMEELIRTAWANKVIDRKGRNLECRIEKHDILRVLLERPEFDLFTHEGLGKAVT